MDPQKLEKPAPEKEISGWEDDFSLSRGSCCDEGEPPDPVDCSLK